MRKTFCLAALGLLILIIIATCECTTSSPQADAQKSVTVQTLSPAAAVISNDTDMKTIGVIGGVSWESSIE